MADFVKLVESMKRAALDAVAASNPVIAAYGTVTSASPLEITVNQKMTLREPQLILTRSVTDHYIDMSVRHSTELETDHIHSYFDSDTGLEASGSENRDTMPTEHAHIYNGKKRFFVHNALKSGETVLLLRVQGGQKYIILDRLGGSPDVTDGQWLSQ